MYLARWYFAVCWANACADSACASNLEIGRNTMQQAIIIHVEAENYDRWFPAHDGQQEARKAYGITDGPFYRDATSPNKALVHLNVEDLGRAMEWFKSDEFRGAVAEAGKVKRTIWTAQELVPTR